MSKPLRVGIAGLGRSGWGIHAAYLRTAPRLYKIAAVADLIPERVAQAAAELRCRAYPDAESLIADPDLDLVVVSTYNPTHAKYAKMALRAGKHVLCEKPFGLTVADVDAMARAAKKAGRLVLPFQQRHLEKDFLKVKEICESGVLGDVFRIRLCWHGFGRRWDWQTARSMAGGNLNNNGPHVVDHAVTLFGDVLADRVWAEAGGYLRSGDAEDDLKFILQGAGHPTVEVELANVWACGQERWTVCGTRGGLHGTDKHLEWKWVDFDRMPPRPLDLRSTPDRSYNGEKLDWRTGSWDAPAAPANLGAGAPPPPAPTIEFYRNLHKVITRGAAPTIDLAQARVRVATMERIRAAAGIPAKA